MRLRPLTPAAAIAALALAITGCGGSSKPKYCSARSDLQSAVSGLTDINPLSSGGLDKLKTQFQKIQSSAQDLQSSAKSDFPDQVNALKSSTAQLQQAVSGLSGSTTPAQVAGLAGDAKSVVSASQDFVSAAASKCD